MFRCQSAQRFKGSEWRFVADITVFRSVRMVRLGSFVRGGGLQGAL
jgi:hypothetical protein